MTTFFFFYAPFTKSSQRARRQVVIKAIPKIGIDKLIRIFQCKVLSLSANAFWGTFSMPPPFIAYEIWELQQTKYLKIFSGAMKIYLTKWCLWSSGAKKLSKGPKLSSECVNIENHLKCLWCNKMFLTMVELQIYQTL